MTKTRKTLGLHELLTISTVLTMQVPTQNAYTHNTKGYPEKYEHLSDRLLSTFKSLRYGGDV